jgi:hypothetical protein
MLFFWTNFVEFLTKIWEIFGKLFFSSMSLINFAIFLAKILLNY